MGILNSKNIDNSINEKNKAEQDRLRKIQLDEELHKYVADIIDEFLDVVKKRNIPPEEIEVYQENSMKIGLFDKKPSYKKDKIKVWNIIKLRDEHFFEHPFIENYASVYINNDKILKNYYLHSGIPKSEYEDTNLYIDAEKNCYFEANFSEIMKKGEYKLVKNNINVMVKAKIDAIYEWLFWIGEHKDGKNYYYEHWDNAKNKIKEYIEKRISQMA